MGKLKNALVVLSQPLTTRRNYKAVHPQYVVGQVQTSNLVDGVTVLTSAFFYKGICDETRKDVYICDCSYTYNLDAPADKREFHQWGDITKFENIRDAVKYVEGQAREAYRHATERSVAHAYRMEMENV